MVQVPELLTPRQVAEILNISYENALSLIRYGNIPCVKVGRQYRVKAADLSAFIRKGGTQ